MKQFLKRNVIICALIVVGLLASLLPIGARISAEQKNKNYDLILSYSDMKVMALQSGMSNDEWLELFKECGIQRVSLNEINAKNFNGSSSLPMFAYTLKALTATYYWEEGLPDEVIAWIKSSERLSDAMIIAENEDAYSWILNAYLERTDELDYKACTANGKGYIFLPTQNNGLTGTEMLELCLGMWPEDVETILAHGLEIMPKTVTYDGINGKTFADAFIEVLKEYNSPYFLNAGDTLLGYDTEEGKATLIEFLSESGIGVSMYEQNDQSLNLIWDGFEELLEKTGYNGVRFFNEWSYIQNRYQYCGYDGPQEITNSLYRAIAERNCNVVLLKMILEADNDVSADASGEDWTYVTDPDAYRQLIGDLEDRLAVLGYSMGVVSAIELDSPSIAILLAEALGITAAWILLGDMFLYWSDKTKYILLAIGFICFAALAFAKTESFKLILCMTGGIVMPALAAVGLCRAVAEKRNSDTGDSFGKILGYTLVCGLLAVLTAFCGSLMASATLSEIAYMIEIKLYRGVKLMQLIPIGVFGLSYLMVFAYEQTGARAAVLANVGKRGNKGRIRRFWNYLCSVLDRPMKLSWFTAVVIIAVAAVFMLLAGVYYISRTGNTTSASELELSFRNMLENLLLARPRTKELLIGWPCLMLFIWSLRRRMNFLPLIFGLGMCIGLVSIVNTFLHIRTPFLLSLLRTGWGVLFGFIIAIVCVVIAELLYRFARKIYFGGENA